MAGPLQNSLMFGPTPLGPHVRFKIWGAGLVVLMVLGQVAAVEDFVSGTTLQDEGTTLYVLVGQQGLAGTGGFGGSGGGLSGVFTGSTPSQVMLY